MSVALDIFKDDDGTHVYEGKEFLGMLKCFGEISESGRARNYWTYSLANGDGWYGSYRTRKLAAEALLARTKEGEGGL